MSKLDKYIEIVRDSEAFQQLKAKYDELDGQSKLYVNLGALAAVVLFVFLTILISIAKLNGMKSDINEREELIGYLQRSADSIKQLRAQKMSQAGNVDTTSPLPVFVDSAIQSSGLDHGKIEVGSEKPGAVEKDAVESLVEVKMNQVNLRQVTRLLFALTDAGSARNLTIKDLLIDTKNDPSGYMDSSFTISTFKAK